MDRTVDAVVTGMGYVGLPLAQEASAAGLTVIGFDVNPEVVDGLNHGPSHVDDLADSDVVEMLGRGFYATTDAHTLRRARTIVVCVPTPLSSDGLPDLGPLRAAAVSIAEHLQSGTLVILESTTYPGTTDEEIRPILEAGGLVAGRDFALVYSPERIDPGNNEFGPKNTPKVIGGHTSTCADAAEAFYSRFIDAVVRTKGTREAETAKLLENTYRHINIALVNEMARFCHDLHIDLWDVHRRRRYETFWISGISARSWSWRSLHPHRPELPVSSGTSPIGLSVPLRRAGSRDQCRHAELHRTANSRSAQS